MAEKRFLLVDSDVLPEVFLKVLQAKELLASGEVSNISAAARQAGRTIIAAAGGVAANTVIRGDLERACAKQGCKLYLPPLKLCGDNGAMIGAQGYYEYLAGHTAGMELNAYATRDIAE